MGQWLIDGNNLMGSRPDGWWKDRAGGARRLAAEVEAWCHRHGERAVVVFDGPPPPGTPFEDEPGAHLSRGSARPLAVVFAGPARGSADDEIVRRMNEAIEPQTLTVVTSDKGLVDRVRPKGPAVVGTGTFLGLLANDPR